MLTRRQIILALTVVGGGTMVYTGSAHRAANQYYEAVHDTWRHTPPQSVAGDLAVNRENETPRSLRRPVEAVLI